MVRTAGRGTRRPALDTSRVENPTFDRVRLLEPFLAFYSGTAYPSTNRQALAGASDVCDRLRRARSSPGFCETTAASRVDVVGELQGQPVKRAAPCTAVAAAGRVAP